MLLKYQGVIEIEILLSEAFFCVFFLSDDKRSFNKCFIINHVWILLLLISTDVDVYVYVFKMIF